MSGPVTRPKAKEAGPELLVLQKWEDFTSWFLEHTGRWPKSVRFTLAQRVENHTLDVIELLVAARYDPAVREANLRTVNLVLERLRYLLRVARARNVSAARAHEHALRQIDEAGRMLHGWRETLRKKGAAS